MAQDAANNSSSKIAVITGVSKGIGAELVKQFITNGWTVFGCARSAEKIKELNTTYPNKDGKKVEYFSVVDVTNEQNVKDWANQICSNYNAPNIIIANAGYSQKLLPLEATELKTFELSMDVNVKHPFLLSQAFLPFLRKSKENCGIFGMSSGAGRQGMGLYATYCASKYALEGLFASMAKELENSDNLMCATYDPGMAATEMFASTNSIDNIDNVGMPTPTDAAKAIYEDTVNAILTPKENNGKQLTSPMMNDPKFKDKLMAGMQQFMQAAQNTMKMVQEKVNASVAASATDATTDQKADQ